MNDIAVIKVGGNEIDDEEWIANLARAVARGRAPTVIVHGGGKEVSAVQRSLGAKPEWRDGLRVTTPQALASVRMVLSGLVNKRLVGALMAAGVPAVGVSGEDAGMIRAVPAMDGALGATGTPDIVQPALIQTLIAAGFLPVVSPVSAGRDGGALNVNADDAAAAIAIGVGAGSLLFISDVPGVLSGGMAMSEIQSNEIADLVDGGVASGGMVPKLRAAAHAALGGVADVRIGGLDALSGRAGTRVVAASTALVEV